MRHNTSGTIVTAASVVVPTPGSLPIKEVPRTTNGTVSRATPAMNRRPRRRPSSEGARTWVISAMLGRSAAMGNNA